MNSLIRSSPRHLFGHQLLKDWTRITDGDSRDQLETSVADNQRALSLAQVQYKGGIGSFLQVLIAERSLLSAQQDLAENTTEISTNLVSLYKALGGGWEATYPDNDAARPAAASTSPGVPTVPGHAESRS
jgi:hypothetical protein